MKKLIDITNKLNSRKLLLRKSMHENNLGMEKSCMKIVWRNLVEWLDMFGPGFNVDDLMVCTLRTIKSGCFTSTRITRSKIYISRKSTFLVLYRNNMHRLN